MSMHFTLIGILFLLLGLLGLGGILLALVLGAAGVALAALVHPLVALGAAPWVALTVVAWLVLLTSFPALLVGWGILRRRPWAPLPAVVLAVLHLVNFPLGTAFGAWVCWAFLSARGQAAWRAELAAG